MYSKMRPLHILIIAKPKNYKTHNMRKLTTLFAILMLCVTALLAQAPNKFSYQAVVRNASNQLETNTLIGIRVSILQNSATGSVVYSETQMLSTNANGLVTLNIGEGTVVYGNFNNIDWSAGTFFLKSEIDPTGGNSYSITSTQQLLSVPYALYANEAGNGFSGNYNDLTNKPTIPTVPTNVSAFTNDAGYLTGYTETDPVFTAWDKNYNDLTNLPQIPQIPADISAFNNDAGYITGYTETDPVFSAWDKNYNDLTNKPALFSGNYNDLTNKPTLFSGNYNDLTNKPTIPTVPTVVSAFTNDAGYLTGYSETDPQFNAWDKNYNDLTNKPTLFSGNYNDLTNKPTIPAAANNAMLTIQRNNSTVGTFTADASSDKTVNISVPTTTSELTNNSGYITADQLNALLNAMNSRMDSLQTVLSAQNVEIASLSNTVDSLGAYADSLGNIVDQCGCGQQENACDVATVTDFDGNVYNTVGIGSQCWMAENLRTTHYSDGTEIPAGDRTSSTSPYHYDCSITDVPLAVRGYLYNWPAAMHGASSSSANPSGVQGICPAGWHLPSHAEWTQLIDYVGSQSQYVCDNNPANVAKALAGTTGWLNASITCAVGNDQSANNATGFGAYPAGNYLSGFCGYSSYYADFWSTTEEADGDVFYCRLNRGAPDVTLSAYYKERGYSVRCIRNTGGESDMSQQIIEMQKQMAELQARVDSLSDIVDECGCLSAFHCGTSTISDFDGNAYSTVKLGGKCWMAENLRTTHYSNGDPIDLGTTTSTTTPYRYNPASDSTNVGTYGYLYNWAAVMNGAASSEANPSGVQGICPTGWHVPSNAEWTELETFVSSQSQYVCNHQNSSYIGKALASTTGWSNSTSTACGVGTTQSTNNATGFNARPAGNYYASGGNGFGYYANFWTTTETSGKAYSYNLSYTSPSLNRSNSGKASGFSVRCVRD